MIFNTNRTMSLGDTIDVDVNESYFGAGALNFMQENAEIELELFEAAIKSDIDEYLIGESVYELEALNEGFIQNAAKKIKDIMTKFIEWIKAITRSAIAKLTQFIVRDNAKFCKIARKRIASMKNYNKFKYTGKAIKNINGLNLNELKENLDGMWSFWDKVKASKDVPNIDQIKADIKEMKEEYEKDNSIETIEKDIFYDEDNGDLKLVEEHLKFLESASKDELKKLNKVCKDFETKASKIVNDAEKAEKDYKGEDEKEKNRLAVMAAIASAIKEAGQYGINSGLTILKKSIKVARAVVTKAMGASPKNEGFEYTPELIDAMIETTNYELDEALEEMSEGKECDPDDIPDDEE